MHNSSKSKKSQFFILSVVSMIMILAAYLTIFSPKNVMFSSDIILKNEFFVFNNIVEKSIKTVEVSRNCEELNFNLQEFKKLLLNYPFFYKISYFYNITSCTSTQATVNFYIELSSASVKTYTNFTKTVYFG